MRTVLDFNLNEPMEIDKLPGKGILFVERSGLPNKFGTIFQATFLVTPFNFNSISRGVRYPKLECNLFVLYQSI